MNHYTCVLSHANIDRQNENQFISLVLMLKIFNVSKCKSMLISRKRKCPELTRVFVVKYLNRWKALLLTSDLTWSKHTHF